MEGKFMSEISKGFRWIADLAPDLVDVAVATLVNPLAGVSMVIKKIGENTAIEANIQKSAEAEFQEKLKQLLKDDSSAVITQGNKSKTKNYLTDEINKLAENAIKTNDQILINEVFAFYRIAQRKLLASSTQTPLTTAQLAAIKTELGLMRLKVLWADAQKSAQLEQKFREEKFIQEQAHQLNIKEKALQIRVFLFFVLYIGGIALAILFGSKVWTSDATIPWLDIPISIAFWSAIGSLTNMLYKYYKTNDTININKELRWVWARPLVGVIMGAVTYLVVSSGLILLGAATPQNVNINIKPEILSLFAFIGSFSDKIFEGAVEKIGLIAISEKDDEEKLANLISILSNQKPLESGKKTEEYSTTMVKTYEAIDG